MKRSILTVLMSLSIMLSISIPGSVAFYLHSLISILDIGDSIISLLSLYRNLLILSSISSVIGWIIVVLIDNNEDKTK